jgi:hypothetical protein
MIETSDAEIDKRIGAQDTSDKPIKKLSMQFTAHTIKSRYPQSQTVGEYRETSENILEVWEREIERIFRLYKGASVKATEYRHIDEAKRYQEVGK